MCCDASRLKLESAGHSLHRKDAKNAKIAKEYRGFVRSLVFAIRNRSNLHPLQSSAIFLKQHAATASPRLSQKEPDC
jgi:hypothetical protein